MCPVGANLGSDFQSWWALSPVLEPPHTCRARSLMYGACTVCHCLVAGRGSSYSFSFWTSQEIQSVVRWWGHDSAQRMISRELERMQLSRVAECATPNFMPSCVVFLVVIISDRSSTVSERSCASSRGSKLSPITEQGPLST